MRLKNMSPLGALLALAVASPALAGNLVYTGSFSTGGYIASYSIVAPDVLGIVTAGELNAVTTFSGPGFATYTTAPGDADLYINPFGPDVHPIFVSSAIVGGTTTYSLNFDFTVTNGVAAIFDGSASAPNGGISLCFQAAMTAPYSDFGCNFSTAANQGIQDYSQGAFDHSIPASGRSTVFATATVGGVPEPTTWGMMVLGFGAISAAMRRRKIIVSFA